MGYNTVLNKNNMGDFKSRKAWEVDLALRTLKDHGATGAGKVILGVGAGHEPTIFLLLATGANVVATDLYEDAGVWAHTASAEMLTNPADFVPVDVEADLSLLSVINADMRDLSQFEDNSFDGIFSSGSIEHIGGFIDVAKAAREIGRVLKPGGIASISTEWKISGNGEGWDGILLFDEGTLYSYLIEPSRLVPVDEPYLFVHYDTCQNPASLERIVATGQMPALEMVLESEQHGYLFTSVHLALRKPEDGSAVVTTSGDAKNIQTGEPAATVADDPSASEQPDQQEPVVGESESEAADEASDADAEEPKGRRSTSSKRGSK